MQKANLKGENNIFAIRLKGLMENKVTQQQLADVLNIKRQTVSLYLNGVSLPPIEKLVDIANYFNVSTDYLLGLSGAKSADENIQYIHKYTGLDEFPIMCLHNNYQIATQSSQQDEINTEFQKEFNIESYDELLDNHNSDEAYKNMHIAYFKYLNALISSPKLFLATRYANFYCVSKKGFDGEEKELEELSIDVAEFRYQKCCLDMLNDFFENDIFKIKEDDENADD